MEHKKIENQKNRINLEKINIAEYNEQDRKAIKEFSKMPDYYKILGVKENATLDEIKQASEKKIEQYNPDNIDLKKKLKSLPENERLKESNKNNARIMLIKEARKILIKPESRKIYDIQMKTTKSTDFIHQKNSFQEFIKLQESEITEQSKKNADLSHKMLSMDMDKKHNFKREELSKAPLTVDESKKRYADIMQQRETEDLDLLPSNLFEGGKSFNNVDFNRHWEIQQKKLEKKNKKSRGIGGNDLVLWDGLAAASDTGMDGTDNYVKLNDIGELYCENLGSSNFGNIINDDDIISSGSDSDINMDEIDISYVTNHSQNKIKGETGNEYSKFIEDRNKDLRFQDEVSQTDTAYWGDIKKNPMNISSQLGEVFGGTDYKQLAFNQRDKYIEKDHLEAYKSLVYDTDSLEKEFEKEFGEKKHKSHKHRSDKEKKSKSEIIKT